MCNKYEAHEVYFACVKYDVIRYMTSPCRDELNKFLLSTIKYTVARTTGA